MNSECDFKPEYARKELRRYASKERARNLQRFFKTGPGQYAEGDIFLGVVVPNVRKIAIRFSEMDLRKAIYLLRSPFHEERFLALLILVRKFDQADEQGKKEVYEKYLKNTRHINNWDLVDLSAEKIIGPFLINRNKMPLYRLAGSDNLWERRISILSTFYFIKNHKFMDALKISEILLVDTEDLMHKAVGWMLREIGKRDMAAAERFLKKHCRTMPRTMLRYAIERFPEYKRRAYMKGVI